MFVILDHKWAVPVGLIGEVIPLKVIGSNYNPEGYEVLKNIPSDDATVVNGSLLMGAEDTKQKVEELAETTSR